MPEIDSIADLTKAIEVVNENIQDISDYLNEHHTHSAKIRFPRGYLGTAYSHSKKFEWVLNPVLKKNISYQYIFSDVLRWLANRTDISGVAKHMLYKHAIILIASIAESLLITASKQFGFPERKPPGIAKKFLKEKVIDQKVFDEFNWLWELRQNIHIFLINETEYDGYDMNRPGFRRGHLV